MSWIPSPVPRRLPPRRDLIFVGAIVAALVVAFVLLVLYG